MKHLLLDIGGSGIKYATLENDLKLENEGKYCDVDNSVEGIVEACAAIYRQFEDVDDIGISACMTVDSASGFVYAGGSYRNVRNVNIVDLISEACDHKKVTIENDGYCCLRAELAYGNLKGCQNAAVFVYGSGIGCAMMIDGHIVKGHQMAGAEASLLLSTLTPLSFWANDAGVTINCQKLSKAHNQNQPYNGFDLFRLYRENDSAAVEILNSMCEVSAFHIFNYCMLNAPEKIAIGGGISAENEFVQLLEEKVNNLFEKFKGFKKAPTIVVAKYRNQANLLGAYERLING